MEGVRLGQREDQRSASCDEARAVDRVMAAAEMGLAHLHTPAPLPLTTKATAVLEMFTEDESVMALAVVDEAGAPVGLVTRRNVVSVFGQQFARELYRKKKVKILLDKQALVLDMHTNLEAMSRAMTARDEHCQYDPAIMTDAGRYVGLLSVITLLKRMTDLRIERALDSNPLSRLPGNNSINREIDSRLQRHVAFMLVYIDLDHFKAFNDYYGYERGDRVIQLLAKLLASSVAGDDFVGHVGGDDFVMILQPEGWRAKVERLCAQFQAQSLQLYDDEARARGYIIAENRQGEEMNFPMMTLSIAVVNCPPDSYESHIVVAEVAGEVKHLAKMESGNSIVVNRRQY